MGLFSDKCKDCGCRFGNQFVKGANTPRGTKGRCAPCSRAAEDRKAEAKRAAKARR